MPVRTFPLGTVNRCRVTGTVLFRNDGPGTFGFFRVRFHVRRPDGTTLLMVKDVDNGMVSKAKIQAADFVGLDRKQIFLSVEMGGVTSLILDCDGHRLRTLYQNEVGRVHVSVRRDQRRWKLVEDWPRQQYRNYDGLGAGRDIGEGVVQRLLHWDGHDFVPDRPGMTMIVKLYGLRP